ncbi:MAG: DNA polymerase I [Reyranella sp.]|uniref:DNA polymerase I n=1 Tax=Reyranella sp. TaxID=1929291 RepID=UPI001AC4A5DA|nr:DNA polymerase I [Reyranella sp.]MBN9089782.1 DNA polymerase I [Reyranella sp.]
MAKSKASAAPAPAAAPTPAEAADDKPIKNLYLVDGSGYLFRAFHALPPMNRPDGTPVNAVYGFCRMLAADILDKPEVDHVAMILDASGTTFRNEIYDQYKANRSEPPEDLIPQFPLIREAAKAFNVTVCELKGYEADDLIATYARLALEAGGTCTIVSSDKDLMQLIRPGVEMMDPIKKIKLGPEAVMEKFGVTPDKVIDVQALAGDSTDNVPGVPGIGVKTAAQLLAEYGDLETLLARAGEIKQPKRREALQNNAELARISKQLVTLRDDVPAPADPDSFDKRKPDPNVLLPWLEKQGFKTLVAKYAKELGEATAPVAAMASVTPAPQMPEAQRPAPATRPKSNKPFTAEDYETIRTEAALDEWIAEATKAGVVSVDLESAEAGLVGLSFALLDGPWGNVNSGRRRAAYLPIGHRAPGEAQGALDLGGAGKADGAGALLPDQLAAKTAIGKLKPLLEDPGVLKVGHDLKADLEVLEQHGIRLAPVDDTMLLSFVLDGGKHGHALEDLAERELDRPMVKVSDVAGSGAKRVSFDKVPIERAREYAAGSADTISQLWAKLKPRLAAERMVGMYETIERPLMAVLLGMEQAGVKVDATLLRRLSADFEKRLGELELEIHKLAGREFNVGSPKQLGEILFDEQKLPGGRRSKTGAWSTDASILDELAAQGHALPVKILEHRQIAKLKGTYTDALVRELDARTGRIHTSYMMTGAATGRLASTEPNLQNIPVRTEEGRKIREAFIAEKGHKLVSADYSQIELRLLAHVAEIVQLKDAFARGDDIHAITASEMFGLPVKGMDPLVRRRAKAINFGIIYGISAFGLANQLGIGQPEARDYIAKYFQRYPGIRDYMERTKEYARKNGYVKTPFGRKIHLKHINDKNQGMRAFSERAAINAPLQGGAADIIKRAMIRLPPALKDAHLEGRMLLQVHDELLFEVPDKEVDAIKGVARKVMESAAALSVPLVVETGVGANWAAAH